MIFIKILMKNHHFCEKNHHFCEKNHKNYDFFKNYFEKHTFLMKN